MAVHPSNKTRFRRFPSFQLFVRAPVLFSRKCFDQIFIFLPAENGPIVFSVNCFLTFFVQIYLGKFFLSTLFVLEFFSIESVLGRIFLRQSFVYSFFAYSIFGQKKLAPKERKFRQIRLCDKTP